MASHSRFSNRPLLNQLLRPSPTQGRNRISQSVAKHGCKRDIVRDGAVATGVPYPSMATADLLARSSRIVRHDGAGPHRTRRLPTRCLRGVLPKPLAEGSRQCNSYSLDGQACRAELFAGHPELEEEGGCE